MPLRGGLEGDSLVISVLVMHHFPPTCTRVPFQAAEKVA